MIDEAAVRARLDIAAIDRAHDYWADHYALDVPLLLDALAQMRAERDEIKAKWIKSLEEGDRIGQVCFDAERSVAALTAERDTEKAIVNRVWAALGITTYAQAGGKSIDELVAAHAAERDRLREAINGLIAWNESEEVKATFSRQASLALTHRHLAVPITPEFGRWAKEKWDDARAALKEPTP
jgi:hypothetical protein